MKWEKTQKTKNWAAMASFLEWLLIVVGTYGSYLSLSVHVRTNENDKNFYNVNMLKDAIHVS